MRATQSRRRCIDRKFGQSKAFERIATTCYKRIEYLKVWSTGHGGKGTFKRSTEFSENKDIVVFDGNGLRLIW
jgi:hypothetical protein